MRRAREIERPSFGTGFPCTAPTTGDIHILSA
jgi:hypothetical protein